MYMINGNPKLLKLVRQILDKKGYTVRDTELNEYLVVRRDPSFDIPNEFKRKLKIEEFSEAFHGFLKGANSIRDFLAPEVIRPGDPVTITGGDYKSFKGLVKEVDRDREMYKVQISVYGKIVIDHVERNNLRKEAFGTI